MCTPSFDVKILVEKVQFYTWVFRVNIVIYVSSISRAFVVLLATVQSVNIASWNLDSRGGTCCKQLNPWDLFVACCVKGWSYEMYANQSQSGNHKLTEVAQDAQFSCGALCVNSEVGIVTPKMYLTPRPHRARKHGTQRVTQRNVLDTVVNWGVHTHNMLVSVWTVWLTTVVSVPMGDITRCITSSVWLGRWS